MLLSSLERWNRSFSKSQFLCVSVSVRHVGARPDLLQHGVSTAISVNLGKTFPRRSYLIKNCCDPSLGEGLCIFTFFIFPDSGFLWHVHGFWFLLRSIFKGVTPKTSNYCSTGKIYQLTVHKHCQIMCIFILLNNFAPNKTWGVNGEVKSSKSMLIKPG